MASRRIQAILSLRDDFSSAMEKAQMAAQNFGSEWERQGKQIQKTANKIKGFGETLTSTLTPAMTALSAAGVAAYSEMDAGMDSVIAKTGATGKALEANKEVFNELYRTTAFGAEQIGDAVGYMQAFTDATGNQLSHLSEYALQFSEITGTEVYESVQMASRMMEQFGVTTNQLPRIFDAMAAASQNSGQEVGELFDVVQENVPQLKELGMGFEEAFAFAGNISKAGYQMDRIFDSIKDSQSVLAESGLSLGEGLRQVQSELEGASSDAERLGIAVQYFGEENAAYMLDALDKGVVSLEDFAMSADSSAGTVMNSYDAMKGPMEELQATWNNLKGTAGDFAGALIEGAAPALEIANEKLEQFSGWLSGLSEGEKQALAATVLLVAGIGPLITIVGGLIGAFGSGLGNIMQFITLFRNLFAAGTTLGTVIRTIATFLTGPWGIALTGAIAVGVLLYKNWDTIKEKGKAAFETVKGWVDKAKTAINNLKSAVQDFINNSGLGKIGSMVSSGISTVKGWIGVGSNAEGTNYWRGGLTTINERGGEIIDLQRGARVYPHDKSIAMAYRDGQRSGNGIAVSFDGAVFQVREEADIDRIARQIVKRLQLAERNRGGA